VKNLIHSEFYDQVSPSKSLCSPSALYPSIEGKEKGEKSTKINTKHAQK